MARITDPDKILEIAKNARVIAVVGISPKKERASYYISERVRKKGHKMYYINPVYEGQEILDEKVLSSLKDVPEKIDIVDVFRNPKYASPIMDEAISVNAGVVWLQPGAESEGVISAYEDKIDIIYNACLGVTVEYF
ncbi:MAG: CoA-binding protein [Candidatus Thermoplasmatota archaeon]|nr:CoA-binding protein [Candidatus Thermoplasmatota archaeon]